MIDNKRAAESPVAHLKVMTVTDKQERRALTQDERTALRHTFISEVVRSGATIKEAQTLARHQKAELTIGIYAHAHLNDTRRVVERLQTVETKAVKTGTDDGRNSTGKGDGMPVVCLNSAQHRISVDSHRRKGGKIQGKPERQKTVAASEKRGFPVKNKAKTERGGFEPPERVYTHSTV